MADVYTASTTANVISTALDARLTVAEPGRLMNGTFALAQPVQVQIAPASWTAPVSNAPVTITFRQPIGANERAADRRLLQDADVHAVDDESIRTSSGIGRIGARALKRSGSGSRSQTSRSQTRP